LACFKVSKTKEKDLETSKKERRIVRLPGHCWWVKDQFGRIWNESAFYTHVHVWYYRKALMKEYPQFQFRLHFRQRDPSRPVLYPYKKERKHVEEKEIDPRNTETRNSETTNSINYVAHESEDF
jgi:hypothetical protein